MASAAELRPGEHRCPGPSTRDIILADGWEVPAALTTEAYDFIGDADIAFDRYVAPEFFEREMRLLWPKVWQWACREEHLPEVGDYITYDVGRFSILITRVSENEIKAYHNSCLHRGTQFKPSDSSGHAAEIRCPFHGWSWELDGGLKNIPCRWDFPHVTDENARLPEVKVALWGGFVFINMDLDAPPLEQQLGVLPDHFSGRWDLSKRRIALHLQKELPTNWKAATEAFLEAYHVYETHAQALATAADANAQYDIFSDHVTRFVHTVGYPSPHYTIPQTQQEIFDKMRGGGGGITVPEGATARSVAAALARGEIGGAAGVDLSAYSDSEMLDSIEYHLFPNMCLFPGVSLPMIYRFRPIGMDPGRTVFDLIFLKLVPDDTPLDYPPDPIPIAVDQSYADAPGMNRGLGGVYDQDTNTLAMQYRGFQAAFKAGQTLGNYQEARIRQFQATLDGYLAE